MARTYHVFDLVIIGGGTAGIAALREALKHTNNVVLVEAGEGGTTCARTGCMPSKALIHAAKLYASRLKFAEAGLSGAEHVAADMPRILRRVRRLRDHYVNSVMSGLEDVAPYIVQGVAKYESPTCLRVDSKLYHTRASIIATGSTPFIPKEFADLPKKRIITSDTLFEQRDLPERIGFVGLGPLGLELAQALAFLDRKVVAVQRGKYLGGIGDEVMNRDMLEVLSRSMTVYTNATSTATLDGDVIRFTVDRKVHEVDALFLSAGRRPALDALGLRRLKVPLKDSGVPWYDPMTLQVSGFPIFLAGDATDERAILHEANTEGRIAAYNACHLDKKNDRRHTGHYVPLNIIFTEPNIASVGMDATTAAARRAIIAEAEFANQGRALMEQRNEGRIRLFLSPEDTTLLGAELMAPQGEHIAHLLALAIQQQLTARKVLDMPFYHPTFEEALRTALRKGVKAAAE